jgi:hypothetical protein
VSRSVNKQAPILGVNQLIDTRKKALEPVINLSEESEKGTWVV